MLFAWITDPNAWLALGTLTLLEIVLGIDNIIFLSLVVAKLPTAQRNHARRIGLAAAMIMRLALLASIAWVTRLTNPLFELFGEAISARDLILLLGGLFLIWKASKEIHESIEGEEEGLKTRVSSFLGAIVQIMLLDIIFSLDSVITAVGLSDHLFIMMAAVVIAMAVMLLASKPLTRFVNQHPTVVVLCLSFLLMIGLSLVAEGFGFHIPKGYLYAAIGFSIIIELFNQIARRNFIRHQSTLPLRARTADAILRLMGGKRIMTPRGEISWVDADLSVEEIREQLLSSPHSLFPVCRGELDEIIGIVRAKELLVALEDGVDVAAIASASPAIVVPETLDPINLLGVLRRARGSFVIVTNEFGVVQGWLVKGGTDLHALQQALDVDTLVNEDEDIATVAGLVIAANGHIPRVGDVIEVAPLSITIVEANDYRVDLVRIVKEQPAHDEDE